MTRAIIAFAALGLAACTPAGNKTAPVNQAEMDAADNTDVMAVDNGAAPGNALAAVLAMPDRQRNIVFVRALLDADLKCEGVTSSERLPDQDGKPLWRANCKNGTSHMIAITPDGTANIVSRTDR
jgi:hypothetical protein